MGFPTKIDHFGVFWGYHHLTKHPNSPQLLLHLCGPVWSTLHQRRWCTTASAWSRYCYLTLDIRSAFADVPKTSRWLNTTQVVWGFQKKTISGFLLNNQDFMEKSPAGFFVVAAGAWSGAFFHITERRRWNWCFHPLVAMWVDWQRGEIIIANPDGGLIGVEPFLCTTCMACMCFCSRRYTV